MFTTTYSDEPELTIFNTICKPKGVSPPMPTKEQQILKTYFGYESFPPGQGETIG